MNLFANRFVKDGSSGFRNCTDYSKRQNQTDTSLDQGRFFVVILNIVYRSYYLLAKNQKMIFEVVECLLLLMTMCIFAGFIVFNAYSLAYWP